MIFLKNAGILRRQLLAVIALLILAGGFAYEMKSAPKLYSDRAAVVFGVANNRAGSRSHRSLGESLITTETMLTEDQMTLPGQRLIRDAGGAAQFELAPFNLSNMRYPDYAEPYATLTTTSRSPAAAHRTFKVVVRVLAHRLAAIQAGVSRRNRIKVYLAGKTGVRVQRGSSARAFGGLALLTIVAVGMAVNFLDRRQGRMSTFRLGALRPHPFRLPRPRTSRPL
jgi:hypothetical protein